MQMAPEEAFSYFHPKGLHAAFSDTSQLKRMLPSQCCLSASFTAVRPTRMVLVRVEPSPTAFVGGGRQALNRPCCRIIELKA